MSFTHASGASILAFEVILITVITAIVIGAGLSERRLHLKRMIWAGAVIFLWLGLVSWSIKSGFLGENPFPEILIFFLAINLASIVFAFSPIGGWLTKLPLIALIGFQAFRFPLELILHSWVEQGTIPETMTWSGQNIDIVSGIVAILGALLIWIRPNQARKVAWVVNSIGLLLLINVGRVAMMSSPVPFGWGVEPPLLLAFYLPYVLIVPVCVGGALVGHVVTYRALSHLMVTTRNNSG